MADQSTLARPVASADHWNRVPPQQRFPVIRRFLQNRLAVAGFIIIVLFYAAAFLEPVITTYPYDELLPGMRNTPPSSEHWMGTDRSGRDVYSRLVKGGQVSLAAGFAAVLIVMTIGTTLGALAGFFGGIVDAVI